MSAVVADNSFIDTGRWLDGDDSSCEQLMPNDGQSFVELLLMLPSTFQKITEVELFRPSTTPVVDVTIVNDTSSTICVTGNPFTVRKQSCQAAAFGQYVKLRAAASFQLCEVAVYGEGTYEAGSVISFFRFFK